MIIVLFFLHISTFTIASSNSNSGVINRQALVSRYNPTRNASSTTTPMQVGNGNFAFGADITGLQTFQPYAIMSSWGWKNDSLPSGVSMADILAWNGTELETHGRLVDYAFSTGTDVVGQWLISNPNRVNLGRIGLAFLDTAGHALNTTEDDLLHKSQTLDLWTGTLTSHFTYREEAVTVQTICSQDTDTIAVQIESSLLHSGGLGVFLDFPWNDGSEKFEAPFVGSYDNASLHTTQITLQSATEARISHTLVDSTFYTALSWNASASSSHSITQLSRDDPAAHRYTLRPSSSSDSALSLSVTYSLSPSNTTPSVSVVQESSTVGWNSFWTTGGFVDLVTGSTATGADELQRRIILSQYLLAVNEAGDSPTQESGLVNNGWYGKFHLEMVFWHMAHWSLWSKQNILNQITSVYSRFLPTSIQRAQIQQGYSSGARWGKMSDPSGRSAPGEINVLLIWQQPHPIIFAELEYRSAGSESEQAATLVKWDTIVENTADFMAAFAWWNTSTGVYDLGPPMYPVSENTDPLVTINPTFELAYWRLGLDIAADWRKRQGKSEKSSWTQVRQNLAPLPTDEDGRYVIYEGLNASMWSDPNLTSDHPALLGVCGWLPPVEGVNITTVAITQQEVWNTWNISDSYGWDMPMLAMSAARLGNTTKAVEWLLHPLFQFDDVGMPIGGSRVPTPYFPASGSLLYAIAMMAAGWDGVTESQGAPGFPEGWQVRSERLQKAI
ncbi:hypothetical protein K439DRAFT_1352192 [Ramaria rubella]|nr:hypothetical protein K439DRAFT_1352192 [Ramaria rubella]